MQTDPEKTSIKEIFLAAIRIVNPEERAQFLDRNCGNDASLRAKLEQLLAANDVTTANHLDLVVAELGLPTSTVNRDSIATGDFEPPIITNLTNLPLQFGNYKVLERIGEGGMGVVYMAEQTAPVRRKVAIKVIKPGMDTEQVLVRFEAERQALSLMNHPNIATVFDAGTTPDGRPYFVMELIKGRTLTKYCDEMQLSPQQRLELFIPVCQAVQHAHQKGIIHRDLKPSNILVTLYDNKPVPKVIDFGVAKAIHQPLTAKTMFTRFGQVIGTLEYMSPEQACFNQLDVDTRSDIYSLGVLLYELLTGSTPHDSQSLRSVAWEEMLRIIREVEPPLPSQRLSTLDTLPSVAVLRSSEPKSLSRQVRGELDWIVMKALDKERNRRYASANELAADINRFLANETVMACPPSRVYRFRKFASRNRGALVLTLLFGLTLLAGSIGTLWQAFVANQEREKARLEAATAEAISDFLQRDLIAQSDSTTRFESNLAPDPDIRISDLLNRASERINGRFNDLPMVEGSLRFTIGRAYSSLGLYDKAEPHLQRALHIGETVVGKDHPGTLRVRRVLAEVYMYQGKFSDATKNMEECLVETKNLLGPAHEDTISVVNAQIVNLFEQRRYDDARLLAEEYLPICQQSYGPEHPFTAQMLANLAAQYSQLGRTAEAIELEEQAFEIRLETLGKYHPATLDSLSSIGTRYFSSGQMALAERTFRELIKAELQSLKETNPEVIRSRANLGAVLLRQQKYTESEEVLLLALEHAKQIWGEEYHTTHMIITHLTTLYTDTGKFDDALKYSEKMLSIAPKLYGDVSRDTAHAKLVHSSLLSALKRLPEAESYCEQALSDAQQSFGPLHPETLTFHNNLGVIYYKQNKFAQAEETFRQILAIRLREFGPNDDSLFSLYSNLASALVGQNRFEEAYTFAEPNAERVQQVLGLENIETLTHLTTLASFYRKDQNLVDKSEKLEKIDRQLLTSYTQILGPYHQETLSAMVNLAGDLYQQGKTDEANLLLENALHDRNAIDELAPRARSALYKQIINSLRRGRQTDRALQLAREFSATLDTLTFDSPLERFQVYDETIQMFGLAFSTMLDKDLQTVQSMSERAVTLASDDGSISAAIPQDRIWYLKDLISRLSYEQFDYPTAIAIKRDYLAYVERTSGATSSLYYVSLRQIAKSLAAKQQYKEAIEALQRAVEASKAGKLPDAQLPLALPELFNMVLASGDHTNLEATQLKLTDDLSRLVAKVPNTVLRLAGFDAQRLYEQGEIQQSIDVMSQAVNDFMKGSGEKKSQLATLHLDLIALYIEKDDLENAQRWFDRLSADEATYENLGFSYELRKDTLHAQLLIRQGRTDDALQLLLSHEDELAVSDMYRPIYYLALSLIGECYSLQGNATAADQYLRNGLDGLQHKTHFYTHPKRWRERLLAECQRRLAEHQERVLDSAP